MCAQGRGRDDSLEVSGGWEEVYPMSCVSCRLHCLQLCNLFSLYKFPVSGYLGSKLYNVTHLRHVVSRKYGYIST